MKLISLILFIVLSSPIDLENDYRPKRVVLCGNILDFSNDSPLKRKLIFFKESPFISGVPGEWNESNKSTSKGKFVLTTWMNENDPTLYLYVDGYASMRFVNCPISSSSDIDTIDLGNIYLVRYDNEMKEESYNMPPRSKHEETDLMSISEIDSTLRSNQEKYNMMMLIDTTENMISRHNFGPKKPRGTTIQSFKTVTFIRDMKVAR